MYILEAKIAYPGSGKWHIVGEYPTIEEAEQAERQYIYDCDRGDLNCYTEIVPADLLS